MKLQIDTSGFSDAFKNSERAKNLWSFYKKDLLDGNEVEKAPLSDMP
jgi:hypothetical protein